MLPWVVSALKSGTSELILNDMMPLPRLTAAPCKSWLELGPRPTFPTVPAGTVPFRLYPSFERCVSAGMPEIWARRADNSRLRRRHREDGLISIERPLPTNAVHGKRRRISAGDSATAARVTTGFGADHFRLAHLLFPL